MTLLNDLLGAHLANLDDTLEQDDGNAVPRGDRTDERGDHDESMIMNRMTWPW